MVNGEWRVVSGVVDDLAIGKGAGVLDHIAFQIKADRGLRVALVVLQVSAMQGPMAWYVKQDDASRGRRQGKRVSRVSGCAHLEIMSARGTATDTICVTLAPSSPHPLVQHHGEITRARLASSHSGLIRALGSTPGALDACSQHSTETLELQSCACGPHFV